MCPYPDDMNWPAFDAQAPRYLSSDADADLATLEFFARRADALSMSIAAWTPCTGAGDEAHYAVTEAMDKLREAIGLAQRALEVEGV